MDILPVHVAATRTMKGGLNAFFILQGLWNEAGAFTIDAVTDVGWPAVGLGFVHCVTFVALPAALSKRNNS